MRPAPMAEFFFSSAGSLQAYINLKAYGNLMAMTDLPVGMRGLHCPFRPVRRPIQKPQCLRNKDVESDANGVVDRIQRDFRRMETRTVAALAIAALWSSQSLAQ